MGSRGREEEEEDHLKGSRKTEAYWLTDKRRGRIDHVWLIGFVYVGEERKKAIELASDQGIQQARSNTINLNICYAQFTAWAFAHLATMWVSEALMQLVLEADICCFGFLRNAMPAYLPGLVCFISMQLATGMLCSARSGRCALKMMPPLPI
jgi:hypothetical protein